MVTFVLDASGNFIVDENGAFLITDADGVETFPYGIDAEFFPIPNLGLTQIELDGVVVGPRVDAVDGVSGEGGAVDDNLPGIRPTTQTFSGSEQHSFADDFYNRVWVIPSSLDAGVITADLTLTARFWNAHRHAVTLDAVLRTGDASIEVANTPASIKSLAVKAFEVLVDREGDVSPEANFSFDFSGELVFLRVSGIRAKVWPFAPDWSEEVRVTYEYMTEVITSRSGREQRIALRQEPRVSIEFSSLVSEYDYRTAIAQLSKWQNRATLMPDWSRHVEVALPVVTGNAITVTSTDEWMRPGMAVLIAQGDPSRTDHVVRTIESIDGNRITFSSQIDDIPAEALVYPATAGRLDASVQARHHGDRTAHISVKFATDPGYEKLSSTPAAPLTYDGRELFVLEPNWSNEPSSEFKSTIETLDYGIGRLSHFTPVGFNDRAMSSSYLAVGREEADAMRDLFRRQRGQQGEFFMPTFTEDLRAKQTLGYGSSLLRVEGFEAADNYANDPVYRHLMVFYKDGTYEPYRVIAVDRVSDSQGDDTTLDLRPFPSHNINPDDVEMICWLPLVRFNSDQIVVQWQTDQIANVGISTKTLEYLAAEN